MKDYKRKQKPELSEDKLTVNYDSTDFARTLPNLNDELSQKDHPGKIPVKSVEFEDQVPHDPDVEDFIRRCTKKSEAHEIIDFMENKGDISSDKAQECRELLEKGGLKIFGSHKEHGHYEKTYRRNRKFTQY